MHDNVARGPASAAKKRRRGLIRCGGLLAVFFLAAGVAAAEAAERLAVSVNEANIRSGPGPGYDILWKIEKYHPLEITETSGVWLQFRDYEGDSGWIHKSLVDRTPAVITKQNGCQLRAGPGTEQPVLIKIDKGIPFKVLKREGRWINVQHADGDVGWIHDSLVW
jgi:SH3-like domain-containing protein